MELRPIARLRGWIGLDWMVVVAAGPYIRFVLDLGYSEGGHCCFFYSCNLRDGCEWGTMG